jgi:DNA-binding XRE family transcriptional regulator
MRTFDKYLEKKLNNDDFKLLFDEEKELMELALHLNKTREKNGKSQIEVAKEAHITQQQLSKVENGVPCNIKTFIKACHANGFRLALRPYSRKRITATEKHISTS